MVPDTRDSTADNHSSISAVFQVGGLCVFFGRFSFRYLIMTDFFSTFYFFIFSDFSNLSKIFYGILKNLKKKSLKIQFEKNDEFNNITAAMFNAYLISNLKYEKIKCF